MREVLAVDVEMFDERLTSFEARERLADVPTRKGARKTGLDALAAVVILEGWMQAHPEKLANQIANQLANSGDCLTSNRDRCRE